MHIIRREYKRYVKLHCRYSATDSKMT